LLTIEYLNYSLNLAIIDPPVSLLF